MSAQPLNSTSFSRLNGHVPDSFLFHFNLGIISENNALVKSKIAQVTDVIERIRQDAETSRKVVKENIRFCQQILSDSDRRSKENCHILRRTKELEAENNIELFKTHRHLKARVEELFKILINCGSSPEIQGQYSGHFRGQNQSQSHAESQFQHQSYGQGQFQSQEQGQFQSHGQGQFQNQSYGQGQFQSQFQHQVHFHEIAESHPNRKRNQPEGGHLNGSGLPQSGFHIPVQGQGQNQSQGQGQTLNEIQPPPYCPVHGTKVDRCPFYGYLRGEESTFGLCQVKPKSNR